MSEEAQFAWLKAPLRGFFESAASMAGVEIHVTVDPDAPPVGFRAIEACGDRAFWVQTHLLGDPEALVGLILGDELVRILGSKVLMLPDVSDEVTDEIEMAFDEVVNVGIGTWNRDVDDEDKRWDNGVAARSTRRVHLADGPAASLAYRVAGATISFEGKAYPVALAGTGSWLPAAAQVTDAPPEVDAPKDPKAPKKEQELPPLETVSPRGGAPRGAGPASPQAGGGAPQRAGGGAPQQFPGGPMAALAHAAGEEPGAQLVVVDVTGAFVQWFTEQLRNPEFVFSRGNGHVLEQGEYRAVLLVNPHALNDSNLRARDHIVMRRS